MHSRHPQNFALPGTADLPPLFTNGLPNFDNFFWVSDFLTSTGFDDMSGFAELNLARAIL
jgi:hypothetical protein